MTAPASVDRAERKCGVTIRAWDRINEKPLNLFHVMVSKDGEVMGVRDLDGELYGLHQVELTFSNSGFVKKVQALCKEIDRYVYGDTMNGQPFEDAHAAVLDCEEMKP